MVRPGRDGVTHYSYGEGLDHYLPTHPNPRGPVGPVGAHYSYGEGELAELSTQGRHRLTDSYG